MRDNFEKQLQKLDNSLSEFGEILSRCIKYSNKAISLDSLNDAKACLQYESDIYVYDSVVEGRSIKLIMKEQPVAKDLRYISSSLKMVTDMRRIGRQTIDISEIVERRINLGGSFKIFDDLISLGEETEKIVTRAIECRKSGDTSLIEDIIKSDDYVDDYFSKVKDKVKDFFNNEEIDKELIIDVIMIAKYFERIADHAVNIADWVYYSIEGEHIYKKNL